MQGSFAPKEKWESSIHWSLAPTVQWESSIHCSDDWRFQRKWASQGSLWFFLHRFQIVCRLCTWGSWRSTADLICSLNTELTETKTWIKHILACHVNAKCNKLDASTCIIHCHCEHVKPCWFSTFSWWRLLQPPGTAATGWMLKTIHRNKNLNAPFFRTTTNAILSPSSLRRSAHSIPVFAEMGKTVKSSYWKMFSD